jgi:putative membrane protein
MNRTTVEMPPEPSPPVVRKTDLGYVRTRFAADRTLMGWIRTSLSLIGFGFSIFKFFQYLQESGTLQGMGRREGPRHLGVTLVAMGVIFLVMAFAEYLLFLRRLSREAKERFPISTTLIASFALVVVGLFALLNTLFRIGPF